MSYIKMEKEILSEIKHVLEINPEKSEAGLIKAINSAKSVFVLGAGRSGLIAKSFAMRLMQAKINCFAVGETITPSIKKGDLLIALSGSGETKTVNDIAFEALQSGAKVAAITADNKSGLAKNASLVILLKAKTKKGGKSIQPLGSLFEQSAFIFLEGVVLGLMKKNKISEKSMTKKHASLE